MSKKWKYAERDGDRDADNSDNGDEFNTPIITIPSNEPCFPDYSSYNNRRFRESPYHHQQRRQQQQPAHRQQTTLLWRQKTKPYYHHHSSFPESTRTKSSELQANTTRSKRFLNRAAKYADRWNKLQTDVLVSNWKEKFHLIKTSKAKPVWIEIAARVNDVGKGQRRTVSQCKDKIRNLIAKYKRVKASNKPTDDAADLIEYFDELDSVLDNPHLGTLTEEKGNELESALGNRDPLTSAEEKVHELHSIRGNRDLATSAEEKVNEIDSVRGGGNCDLVTLPETKVEDLDSDPALGRDLAKLPEKKNEYSLILANHDLATLPEKKVSELGTALSNRNLVTPPEKNVNNFGSVFSNRDLATLPEIKVCEISSSSLPASSSSMSASDESHAESYLAFMKAKKKPSTDISKARLKRKKSKFEELIDVQRSLIQSFERSNERHYTFLKHMIEEQRQIDANERQKDRDFFLELAKTFASKS